MKTSLLLIGLIMGAGVVGTAQATDATECTHSLNLGNHALASTSSARHGMLSELAGMLSVHRTKGNDSTSRNHGADTSDHASQDYRHQPGPAPAAAPQGQQDTGNTPDNTMAPMSMQAEGNPAPASSDDPPNLGWQSLLPGSIQ